MAILGGALVLPAGQARTGPPERRGPRLYLQQGSPTLPRVLFHSLIGLVEGEVARLAAVFPDLPGMAVRIEFHPGAALLPGGRTGSPWVAAYTVPGSRRILVQHVPVLRGQGRLVPVISHELVHLALAGLGRFPLPLWLEEGMACLHSRELLDAGPVTGLGLAGLERALAAAPGGGVTAWRRAPGLLARARHLAGFLERAMGSAGLLRFCRLLADGRALPDALAVLGGPAVEVLEREAVGR